MNYCLRCGRESFVASAKSFTCAECGFTLFINAATVVAAIIECDRSILACVRAENPYAGELDLPGGFVDHGETAEQALRRELKEELNLRELMPVYFGSYPDIYPYQSVTYRTLTLAFTIKLNTMPDITPADDVASIAWIKRSDLKIEEFAFASIRAALSAYDRAN